MMDDKAIAAIKQQHAQLLALLIAACTEFASVSYSVRQSLLSGTSLIALHNGRRAFAKPVDA